MTQIYIKQNIHIHRTQKFRRISPFGIAPVRKHVRLGHSGIVDHSVDLLIPDWKKKKKKGMDRSKPTNQTNKLNYINAWQQIPVSYGSMPHIPPTNSLLPAAKQETYKKAFLFTKMLKNFLEKVRRIGHWAKKKKKKGRKSNRTW